jgi:hypothetical protein
MGLRKNWEKNEPIAFFDWRVEVFGLLLSLSLGFLGLSVLGELKDFVNY